VVLAQSQTEPASDGGGGPWVLKGKKSKTNKNK
jgi:hypothetical protein